MEDKELTHQAPPPSITEWLARTGGRDSVERAMEEAPKYAEESDLTEEKTNNPLQISMDNLDKMTPEQRAELGAIVGGKIGGAVNNSKELKVIGANIGAVVSRAAGHIKTGEAQAIKETESIIKTLKKIGIIDESNSIMYSDEDSVTVEMELPNASQLKNKKTHSLYEFDKTNPFLNRAKDLAKPIANIIIKQFLLQNPSQKTITNVNAMVTNLLVQDADNIRQITIRASQLKELIGG
jgi:hypothetical protein